MKFFSALMIGCGLAMLIVLIQCGRGPGEPVALEANDMCSFCRMSISEKRYAAELIDDNGHAFKFDDIGCLANFIKQKRNDAPIEATFVMDFERREWLKAENAFYVHSSELKTPMNGGIIAFTDQSSAGAAMTKYHGTMLRFADVTK